MTEEIIHKVIAPRPFVYSVHLDTTAKGFVQPSVTVNSDNEDCWLKATQLLDEVIDEIKVMGLKLVTDIKEENNKESK